eukprot:Lankesteria_metandrocarpae@DN1810_c0_g1_i1.p1
MPSTIQTVKKTLGNHSADYSAVYVLRSVYTAVALQMYCTVHYSATLLQYEHCAAYTTLYTRTALYTCTALYTQHYGTTVVLYTAVGSLPQLSISNLQDFG